MTTDEQHIDDAANGDRNTDICIFKEGELQLRHTSGFQSHVCNDVWRRTDQCAGTAEAGSKCQRHENTGWRKICFLADADDDRNEAGRGAGIREEGRHDSCDDHDADHQLRLTCTENLDDTGADVLGQARVEHRCTDDEHAAKEHDSRISETEEYLFERYQPEQPAANSRSDRGDRQRNLFGNEKNGDDKQKQQTFHCWIHRD